MINLKKKYYVYDEQRAIDLIHLINYAISSTYNLNISNKKLCKENKCVLHAIDLKRNGLYKHFQVHISSNIIIPKINTVLC